MFTALILCLLFVHFLADYTPLSTPWMLEAKRAGRPLEPIASHAAVHMLLCLPVLLFFSSREHVLELAVAWWMIGVSHFLIDTLKGRINGWYPPAASPVNKCHWVIFGLDQYLHAAVLVLATAIMLGWR
jgi:hypothetical protein